jgi:hypothetical protein
VADWTFLRDQILDRVAACPVTAIRPKPPYGVEYEVRIQIDGMNGETHSVLTGGLVPDEGPPRLLAAYVELPRLQRADHQRALPVQQIDRALAHNAMEHRLALREVTRCGA